MPLAALRSLTRAQRHVVAASYLGWMLDAFDFFLLIFLISDVSKEFDTSVATVTGAIALTLAFRPVGAFVFGRLADRYGRKPVMMIDVLLYAGFGFLTAFSPNLIGFFVIRALFGIAMGGEWGVGASLTMESIPASSRGTVSGLLQAGYPSGLLLASAAYWLFYSSIGWRGMFMLGLAPAVLVLYIRGFVPESPGFRPKHAQSAGRTLDVLKNHWRLAIFAMMFMMAMNFFSHGTQDLYPTFLKIDLGIVGPNGPHMIGAINCIAAAGAILGGLILGTLSQRIGRRWALVTGALLSLPFLPLWAFPALYLMPSAAFLVQSVGISKDIATIVVLSAPAFLVQFMVQGCWGIIPAYLNELSPPEARGTFPGVVYQLGNFLAFYCTTLQASLAVIYGSYGAALALVAALAAIAITAFALTGQETKEIDMAESAQPART